MHYICSENKGFDHICAVTANLICAFVFACAKRRCSHDAALSDSRVSKPAQ